MTKQIHCKCKKFLHLKLENFLKECKKYHYPVEKKENLTYFQKLNFKILMVYLAAKAHYEYTLKARGTQYWKMLSLLT